MANSPGAVAGGSYRVIRIQSHVTETVVVAADGPSAKAAARALPPEAWTSRPVYSVAGTDTFEYDVVLGTSDDGA